MRLAVCFMIAVVCFAAVPVLAQTATPTPTPTALPFPTDDLYQALATSEAIRQQQANQSLQSPNGVPLLPATDGREIFGYAKWLLSPTGAGEIGGALFSTIIIHIGILVVLQMSLIAVYVVILILVYTIRWVIFIIRLVIEIFRTLLSFVGLG